MEGHEPDSRYLVLWVCVIIAAGIILVGWFISMRHNFNEINAEMNNNVGQNFEQAEQQVLSLFGDVEKTIDDNTQGLELTEQQTEAIGTVEDTVTGAVKDLTSEKAEEGN